jgi:hypothetical protein
MELDYDLTVDQYLDEKMDEFERPERNPKPDGTPHEMPLPKKDWSKKPKHPKGRYIPPKNPIENASMYYTYEQMQEFRRQGGYASAKKQRMRKLQREILKDILSLDVPDKDLRAALVAIGLDPSVATQINYAVATRAMGGDVESARYVRDTIGEKPVSGIEVGNLDDKPFKSLDMSKLTDEQLAAIAARRAEDGDEDDD